MKILVLPGLDLPALRQSRDSGRYAPAVHGVNPGPTESVLCWHLPGHPVCAPCLARRVLYKW